MARLDEELEAAKAAKTAIDNLSPNIGATIRNARDVAAHALARLPSGRLDDARSMVVAALYNLSDAPEGALQERIEEAKAALEEWIRLLKVD
jgi:hypothetical protein